jgi:long-chain acyl-CoA synthetase
MKRAVLCVENPQNYIDSLNDYSIMIINPNTVDTRKKYLLDRADWSLLITSSGTLTRNGGDYGAERVLWYTSGTTGDSKFCSFTQAQIDNLAQRIVNTYDITENDRYVSIMPLWHAHGQGLYWATRRAQCEVNFATVKSIRTIEQLQPTFISAIPDVLRIMLNLNLHSLRFIRSASAPLPIQLFYDLQNKFNKPVIEAFGMTEALSHCFTNPLYGEQRPGTVGLPDGIEADIVDGQLYIQGPTMASAGWYNTGDLADRDSKGYYRILGRHRDQINIKGIKLNPVSLENQLKESMPEVTDCVIFGSDTVKCLFVGDADPAHIQQFLTGLGPYCRADLLRQIDAIPVSPSGKISRSWLDTQY